jgi:hypothetical protein
MKKIKAVTFWIAMIGAIPAAASAQVTAVGYAFGAPGFATCGCGESMTTLHAGGGGEARIADTLGIGADVGYLGPFEYFSEGFGMLSVNGSYYLQTPGGGHRIRPFVTTGYTMAFRDGNAHLWNVGGGLDYWTSRRVGLRFEVRDHIWVDEGRAHFWGPRIGIVVRGR